MITTYCRSQNESGIENFGFIDIKTDSMDVPLFVDGIFIGSHPLDDVIPVLPGFHEVSYIPPEIQKKKVRENLTEGIKRVYVAKNDTLKVFLFYDHYLAQVKTVEKQIKIQNYIGFSLFGMLIFLILSIY
tara:strand:+ start:2932 stop:3321 length:390 start_codon:yes stop_codon:yes gene_type:complete